eukprot:CAMPEP_0172569528 /NCGR_PEP_ID=MMETSP1067-20121228/123868_1 /TAXON_ID=265564 ORGANISM="Thalassiosira punctigera, Strain Tpunct2005C2" /NCGR_SAMPLE_ID=MMETSP1067 /ASSEMBLY_ACC=CAM_ASM_000444 /LENGTH=58 /DNA_ID=CAMNT_0013361375 /DNA_START=170 /DNA_END=342 /DNA_ORIENTATION=-
MTPRGPRSIHTAVRARALPSAFVSFDVIQRQDALDEAATASSHFARVWRQEARRPLPT